MIVKSGILFAVVFSSLAFVFVIPQFVWTKVIAALMFLLCIFVLFFFRDPGRLINSSASVLLAPADGKVLSCEKLESSDIGQCQVVRIFLSIFNVHIQRSPINGTVQNIERKKGAFKAAYKKEASEENAKNTIIIKGDKITVAVTQIVGLIARRIECWVKVNEAVEQGQKIGFIRFGSQVDIFMPSSVELCVKPGDNVKAGITKIGVLE
ncbi:MAG: phosphatidylserine decarboxylase [bacterium]